MIYILNLQEIDRTEVSKWTGFDADGLYSMKTLITNSQFTQYGLQ